MTTTDGQAQQAALTALETLKAARRAEQAAEAERAAAAAREAAARDRREFEAAVRAILAPVRGGAALLAFAADWGEREYSRESRLTYRKVTFRVPGHADVILYLARSEKPDAWRPASDVDDEWPTWGVDGHGGFDTLADALLAASSAARLGPARPPF